MSPMACSCFVASRSDDVRLRVDPSNTVFFRFNPLDLCVGVVETIVRVEHHEEKPMPDGSIIWQVGAAASPSLRRFRYSGHPCSSAPQRRRPSHGT